MLLRPEDLPDTPAEPQIQIPHEFETDVLCLVSANHNLTVQAIAEAEKRLRKEREEERGKYTEEEFQQILDSDENFYQDLRVAARNQALVALITRLHHRATKYAQRIDATRQQSSLRNELEFLNTQLGDGPVEVEYFVELIDVRNSVVHANSKPTWIFLGQDRKVVPRYAPQSWRVEISENDLQYAVWKATKQVLWYDERLHAKGK